LGVSRGLLFALIAGIASAILSIGSFGSAPILAIGLYLGSALAGISAGTAALLILLNFNSISTIFFIAGTGLPALLIVRQALISQPGITPNTLSWYPPGKILAWLTGYGILILGCVAIYFAFSNNALETASGNFLREIFAQILDQSNANFRSDADRTLVKTLLETAVNRMAPMLAGFLLSIYLLMLIGNATITQSILNRAGISLRPSPSYVTMDLPRWISGALAAALVAAVLPGTIGILGQNAVLILSIPFLLLGLTVIHTLSRRTPNPKMVLAAIYFALFLFVVLVNISLPVLALLVLLGIAEQWFSLRKRFSAPGANQEDE
jgi:hypothetical protein